MNFAPNGDPAITVQVTTNDPQVKWEATLSYQLGFSGWCFVNGGFGSTGIVATGTGSGTYTVDVQDSYSSFGNNSFQLRTATIITNPVGNSNWNPQGDGSNRTNFVNQDFWTTGQGGGNNPNVPSPQNPQN